MSAPAKVAYFSMEIALETEIPTYCGGLGVLAGDSILAAADHGVSMVAVTLLYRQGYFLQQLANDGSQIEHPVEWPVADYLRKLPQVVQVTIEGRDVTVAIWVRDVVGIRGHTVPVYFLDTDVDGNSDFDRSITSTLYAGDSHYRLCQEAVLGVGGARALRALGHESIARFHMNEGHAALLVLELLREKLAKNGRATPTTVEVDDVKSHCVFTTHTPIEAGHDRFGYDLVRQVLGENWAFGSESGICIDGVLNMTHLGFAFSRYINGVAKRHGEVSRRMFANYTIDSITNGVYAARWMAEPIRALFDKYEHGWREDNASLRYALSLPGDELWRAHMTCKRQLVDFINRERNADFDPEVFTIAFARRMTGYKRPHLLLSDPERLKEIARKVGPLQIVYAGKAHPHDWHGKELIRQVFASIEGLRPEVKLTFVDNYDLSQAALLTAGVDVWVNTPHPPLEASGTSGMKAALNGIPSLSVLDGWWIEGCIEGLTGWAVGKSSTADDHERSDAEDINSLYTKLRSPIVPMYYGHRDRWIDVMRNCIAINGSFFNSERMLREYIAKAYFG